MANFVTLQRRLKQDFLNNCDIYCPFSFLYIYYVIVDYQFFCTYI